jgi:hypothetical protein
MIAAICIFLVWTIVLAFGRAGVLVFPRAPIKDEELPTYFSTRDRNLKLLMTGISNAATQVFGERSLTSFIRFNLIQYLFFVAAVAWFSLSLAGYDLLSHFVASGLQIHLDEGERDYLLRNFPFASEDMRNGGEKLYVGQAVADACVLFGVLIVAFASVSRARGQADLRRGLSGAMRRARH